MKWRKLGKIFETDKQAEWMVSHAQVPTVLVRDDLIRVYFAARNSDNKALTAYVDLDREDPSKIINLHKEPILNFGKPGTFDDEGIMPGYVLKDGSKIFMYYSGWNQRVTVPYHNSTGLAVSYDNGDTFERLFDGPVLDRTPYEPYLAVTPSVMKEDDLWHIWYISGLKWEKIGEKFEPVYVVKYAFSLDGILWERPNILCIQPRHELEAFSHPSVIKTSNLYRMFYCYRNSHDYRDGTGSYRMGYAESTNGRDWQRKDDQVGMDVSPDGWDSTMICYPYVVKVDDKYYMFYNGNGFGKSGFGYAVLEEW